MTDILTLVRENILNLEPYRSARDEYDGDNQNIFLDANENPFDSEFNRYPDPYQKKLKVQISKWKGVTTENIFLGNGSDEIIDLLIRIFCNPGQDKIMSLNPSYGMYKVSADINNVEMVNFNLDEYFEFAPDALLQKANESKVKLLFICSPNNPSGNAYDIDKISYLCNYFNGILIVDEAYADFSDKGSMIDLVQQYPNLVVMQTLSKAMGAAGLRLGMAFASSCVIRLLNKVKPPYNINKATQKLAFQLVQSRGKAHRQIKIIKEEREKLKTALLQYPFVIKMYPSDANFLLVKVIQADHLYSYLLRKNIVVRNRNTAFGCENCLRITVGTPEQNDLLMKALHEYTH